MTIEERAKQIEHNLTFEQLDERRKKVSEKIDSVANIANMNGLYWLCVAVVDVITSELFFRTFYAENYADLCIIHDNLDKEYKNSGVTYSIYGF